MRYGIFSDVHGNLEAFEAVIKACRDEGVRKFFCVGDIVGYGANPKECIDLIKEIKAESVIGNHDWAVASKMTTDNFNPVAAAAVEWTRQVLTREEIDFLSEIPFMAEAPEFVMVHGSLNKPESFNYLMDVKDAWDTFYLMGKNVCFVGHTHVPRIFIAKGKLMQLFPGLACEVNPKEKFIVNVGSVGQPRDFNPRASYCVYDPDLQKIEIKRVDYNVAKAQKKIYQAGLPEFLARRLAIGQ